MCVHVVVSAPTGQVRCHKHLRASSDHTPRGIAKVQASSNVLTSIVAVLNELSIISHFHSNEGSEATMTTSLLQSSMLGMVNSYNT